MVIKPFVTKALGDNSYLVHSGNDVVIIDPQRDIWRFIKFIEDNDLHLKYVLETHVHNDYISGILELKDRYQKAELVVPKKGEYEFEHNGVQEGDQIAVGNIEFEVLDTPGHTYEHISWILKKEEEPLAAFTGGSLIIGSAGRTDLLGEDHINELTKLQYQSLNKMRRYPENMRIYPTHGAGSFCTSSNPSTNRFSTLKVEMNTNQALTANSIDDFFDRQLSGLQLYPDYYVYMAGINRAGPPVYGKLPLPQALDLNTFEEAREKAVVIDLREARDFAKMHIPGSYNFELRSTTANYIGWIIPFNHPIIFITDNDGKKQIKEISTQLFRIGYEKLEGYLEGGFDTWIKSEKDLNSYNSLSIDEFRELELKSKNILDVRQPGEYSDFHLPNSNHVFVSYIPKIDLSDEDNFYTICTSGQRSAIAASILAMKGKEVTVVYGGGVEDLNN